jgi:hypothetical protein
VNERNVAVCLLPGTELAFEQELKCERSFGIATSGSGLRLPRFREIDKNRPGVNHDALELPDGQIVLVTKLTEGRHATVLQLPASPREIMPETQHQELLRA